MRYQIRAHAHDYYSLETGADQLVEVLAESRYREKAIEEAKQRYEHLLEGARNTIYNFSKIEVVDTKTGETLYRGEFPTEYVSQAQVDAELNILIDKSHAPIEIFEHSYKASDVLYHVDPYLYGKLTDTLLKETKRVAV